MNNCCFHSHTDGFDAGTEEATAFIIEAASWNLEHSKIKASKDSATAQVDAIMMARNAKAYARTALMMCRKFVLDGSDHETDARRLFNEAGEMLDSLPLSMVPAGWDQA